MGVGVRVAKSTTMNLQKTWCQYVGILGPKMLYVSMLIVQSSTSAAVESDRTNERNAA
jgi:hypothetical protein